MENEWTYCAVGNIVDTHIDEDGFLRYGAKPYVGGTKVYIFWKGWNKNYYDVCTIGLNRYRQYAVNDIPVDLITNLRCSKVFKPSVLKIMHGMRATDGCEWFGKSEKEKEAIESFIVEWNKAYNTKEN